MVIINGVSAKEILDSRKEKTIEITIKTKAGSFSSSSPSGKSTGKYEKKTYKKSLEEDIKTINDFKEYFAQEIIDEFDDLKRIEDILEGNVGANTLFAFESAVLKALAKEKKKQVWELINPKARKMPRLVGNCIGGGKHSQTNGKKPDFQEFLLISNKKTVKENYENNKAGKEKAQYLLKDKDEKFQGKKNDENAWMTSLNDKEVLDVLSNLKIPLGLDVASSGFCKRKKYLYENPMLKRDTDEQFGYVANLIKNYQLIYIEDPFEEEDFETHAKLLKKFPDSMIVGDDLIVTNHERLKKAIEMKAVNAIIVKPNQCGSLLEVKRVVKMAKENNIKLVFSHRSGETNETILADLAFGFGADFFKCGIEGDARELKIKRLIEIEKSIK
ncbi:MAG: enolase C-terminal domain-like protein, partial [Nanobdellota archaeon]